MSAKFEKEIFKEINNFRQNPKSIQHQIEVLGKGISRLRPNDPFLKEIDEFIRTIDRIPKMPPVVLNPTLNQVAKDEAKKYSRNESLPEGFLSQNPGLIADSGADEAQTIVPKLLLNKIDKERKGRKILCTSDYTQVGIANTEFEGENYYVIIFAKNDVPKTQAKAQIQTQAQSKVQSQPQVLSQSEQIEGEPELPNIDLSELKQAFD